MTTFLNVAVILIFAVNMILPFVLEGSLNKFSHTIGWGMAIMWFCVAQYSQ